MLLTKLSVILAGLFFAFTKDRYHSTFHRNAFFVVLFASITALVIM